MQRKRRHSATTDTHRDRSRSSAGLQQQRSKNDRGHSRNPTGNHQEPGTAVAGMQQQMRTGNATGTQQRRQGAQHEPSRRSSRIQQGCCRNAAADAYRDRNRNAAKMSGGTADIRQSCGRNATKMTEPWQECNDAAGMHEATTDTIHRGIAEGTRRKQQK